MELKKYQKEVLSDIREYFTLIESGIKANKAFEAFWKARNVDLTLMPQGASLHPYDDSVRGVPNVTVKVPTAGGKTFIACNALETVFEGYPNGKPRVVVWFVPSDEILRQTLRNLRNPDHEYRKKLNSLFNNRVRVVSKEEALMGSGISPVEVMEQVTIFVLSVSSFAANNKDARKSYRENENLAEYARFYDSFTTKVEGAEETSLMQVLAFLNPVVIIDESHNFEADLREDLKKAINPYAILNLTATPRNKSNIISFVDALKLKRENMVKLPVIVYNTPSVSDVLINAINLQKRLEERAKLAEEKGGNYIRPIVLFQAQPRTNEENATYEKIKQWIIEYGVPEDQIKIKTGELNELKDTDLMSSDCPVRFIITVDALKEGWDCPFAYILASLANRTSKVSVEQILGRVLRLPNTAKSPDQLLNLSYVFTSSRDFDETLNEILKSLNKAGYSRKDFVEAEIQSSCETGTESDQSEEPLLFGGEDDNSSDIHDEEKDNGIPEIDSEYIKSRKEAQEEVEQSVDEIEKIAGEKSENYEAEMKNNIENKNDVPADIQQITLENRIKEPFSFAQELLLPRFIRMETEITMFGEGDSFVEIEKTMLEEGFDLSRQDKTFNFNIAEMDAVQIDLDTVGKDESTAAQKELSSKQINFIRQQFVEMTEESQRNNLARDIARRMKIDTLPEEEVKKYVQDLIKDLDKEKIQEVFAHDSLYAERIKKKIETLLKAYREQQFRDKLDTSEISMLPVYRFPNTIIVNHEALGISKGLYKKEGDMNTFEAKVIRKVAELENVVFWHRNAERSGFGINGFINHYPDFIVLLKSGRIVLIETKGDDRDNSDSKDKINLGAFWATQAGDNFRYYMVFDTRELEGAVTIPKLIEKLKQL